MKKNRQTTARSSPKRRSQVVKTIHGTHPVLRHLRLVEHKHTGKLVKVHHSSYLALTGLLVLVGFFLVITQNITHAADNTVSVSAVVQSSAPKTGATITAPVDGSTIINLNPSQIEGTCAPNLFVVVYDGGTLAGSTICTAGGTFSLTIQLNEGNNVLTARNFDNLNQPGPDTSPITLILKLTTTPTTQVPPPTLPETPVIIPGVTSGPSTCDNYTPTGSLPVGGQPHVAVVCVPQTVQVNEDHTIGILVWGGTPPYALNVKWGSGDDTLVSLNHPGYKPVNIHYASSGIYNISVQVTDSGSSSGSGQSAVQVTTPTPSGSITQVLNNLTSNSWFETPVPLYVIAVVLTLGFWGGDIFSRHFGARQIHKRTRRA